MESGGPDSTLEVSLLGEVVPAGVTPAWMDGAIRDLSEKVYAATRARIVTRSQAEIEVLITDLKDAVNAWTQNGSATETAPAWSSDPVGAGKGDVSIPQLIRRWCEELAKEAYTRIRSRDVTYSEADMGLLATNLVNAVNVWLNAGGTMTESAGPSSPYNPNL